MGSVVLPVHILLSYVFAFSHNQIDNSIIGTPQIQCLSDRIVIEVQTVNPFVGRIFSKGQSKRTQCLMLFDSNSSIVEANFPLNECGMMRERKLYPSIGLMESLTIIISFHSLFVTKTDKAFNVKCFYAQARSATLERFVNVSNLAASDISVHDTTVAECRYEIRLDGPNGEMAQFAEVGQNLFHEWSCSGPDDLRILVKDCRVADDTGEQFLILDDRGCAIDPVILGDLEYEQNARKAHVYSNAFKFADTNHISFQCTVQLCSTIQGDQHCTSLSPPSCSVEGFDTNTMLKKYARNLFDAPMQDEVDLHSHTLAILDAKINADYRRLPTNKLDGVSGSMEITNTKEICISQSSAVVYGIVGLIGAAAVLIIGSQCIVLQHLRNEFSARFC